MKFNINSKYSRRAMAGIMIVSALYLLLPYVFQTHSHNAIINARVTAVHSPIEGVIKDYDRSVGDLVKTNDHILTVENIRLNESFVHELEVEKNSLQSRVDGYKGHLNELLALKKSLEGRTGANTKFNMSHINLELAKGREQVLSQQAVVHERELYYDRIKDLAKSGAMSAHEVDAAKFSMIENQNKLNALKFRLKELETEKSALDNGVMMGEGRNDVPYSRQRLDEVIMVISDYKTRLFEQETRISEIEKQMRVEQKRLTGERVVDMKAVVPGMIWKEFVANGSEVVIGTELVQLVNCKTVFIESALSEKKLAGIQMGDLVKYRLIGTNKWHTGSVIGKTGSNNTKVDGTLAALMPVEKNESARVFIKVNPTSLPKDSMCNIGRQVEVVLPNTFNFMLWINRLTSFI